MEKGNTTGRIEEESKEISLLGEKMRRRFIHRQLFSSEEIEKNIVKG